MAELIIRRPLFSGITGALIFCINLLYLGMEHLASIISLLGTPSDEEIEEIENPAVCVLYLTLSNNCSFESLFVACRSKPKHHFPKYFLKQIQKVPCT